MANKPTIKNFYADSGTIGDGITDANVITLTGTADANATVNSSLDNRDFHFV